MTSPRRSRRAFTLIELLIVCVILGIAGAMVIPAMGETNVLRIQAAVRTVVADITFAQSDAVAFQERRALMFDVDESTYRVVQVPGNNLDAVNNTMYDPSRPGGLFVETFTDAKFGGARITAVDFGSGSRNLIFDALGGPVSSPTANTPGPGGTIEIRGPQQAYRVTVESFTGRTTVRQIP